MFSLARERWETIWIVIRYPPQSTIAAAPPIDHSKARQKPTDHEFVTRPVAEGMGGRKPPEECFNKNQLHV